MKYALRPYQVQAVEAVRERLAAGSRACVIVAPTGAGKTVIASDIIERAVARGSRTLFLAHRKELIDQCSEKLDEIGIWHGVIKAKHPEEPLATVQVGSVQTVKKRLHRLLMGFALVIFDECHHVEAESYQAIVDAVRAENPAVVILGLTATPYRADGRGLGNTFDSLVEVATIEQLMREGYLVPARVFCGRPVDLSGVKTRAGDYNVNELAEAVNKPKLVGDIVNSWKKQAAGRSTFLFAVNIAHSMANVEAFRAAGISAEHLDGATPEEEREAIWRRFKNRKTLVLCNVGVATEGVDCPWASALILARPTESRGLWRQMAGRVLRPYPGKSDCIILDHANCTQMHGFLTDPDQVSLTQCSVKRAAPKGEPMPNLCSSVPVRVGPSSDENYEMVEVTIAERAAIAIQQYYEDLRRAKLRGLDPQWASFRYKTATGEWPDNTIRSAAPVKTRWVQEDGRYRLAWA